MISVGQIGKGKFGNKILSKLKNLPVHLEWVAGSKDKWWDYKLPEWVIIASPNEFHYEQAYYFLSKGVNVFCEKPAAFSSHAVIDLYELAKQNNCKFYVDDVLIYEDISPTNIFTYKKWGGVFSNIIDRMAYHHFYLIAKKVNYVTNFKLNIKTNNKLVKEFNLNFNGDLYEFNYNFEYPKPKEHNLKAKATSDALQTMLIKVLTGEANFIDNRYRTEFATKVSELIKPKLNGTVSVIGAGIYGITSAIKLANQGYTVDLFEQKDDILSATSGINQYRVHRGYHYPRSKDTIKSCRDNSSEFKRYYSQAILDNIEHYYAIASEDSKTSAKQYLQVLDECDLEWTLDKPLPNCDLTVKVIEDLFCPHKLKQICNQRLAGCGVNLYLNHKINKLSNDYNYNIIATYSSLNTLSTHTKPYQYEVCEKPLFKLPKRYAGKSIVVMDGPFMCFDPYSDTDLHVAGNVVHALHNTNIGDSAQIPPAYRNLLNKGIIDNPIYTNVPRFIESAKQFFPDIVEAEHKGSMFTVRTVLPNKDSTDERPTLVDFKGKNIYLFSGKIGNCVEAAQIIINTINE